jgi:SAM-dependent methyltransferase
MAPLKLNLGSGTHPTPEGWTAVDCLEQPYPVDVIADVGALPFPDGAAERLYAGHLLEHIPLPQLGAVLAEWRRVLAPGGELGIVGPDIDRAVLQGCPEWLLRAIVAHDPPPGGHAWTCSAGLLAYLLELHGWDAREVLVATITQPEWPNPAPDAAWQLAFLATPR